MMPKGIFKSYSVLIVSFMIMTVSSGIYYSFGIFLKPILQEFGWTRAMTSGAFSFSWIISGIVGVFIGGLTDRYGPRLVVTLCGLTAGIGYLFMSQITSLWQLYLLFGIFVGVGNSLYTPIMSTIARLYVDKRTMMSGIVLVGIGFGLLVLPPLANQINEAFDWRVSFIVFGVIILVIMIICAQFLKQNSTVTAKSDKNAPVLQEKVSSDATGFTFKEAIRTRQFWIMFIMFFCLGFIVNTVQVHVVPYATDIDISASTAANILATIGGASIIGRIVLGGMGDRIGNKRALIVGFVLLSVPMFWLAFARETWIFFVMAIIFGIGYGDCVASESPLVASIFGLKSIGSILGFIASSFTIGAALGPALAAYLFDVTTSYQIAFLLVAVAGIAGLILTVGLFPVGTKSKI